MGISQVGQVRLMYQSCYCFHGILILTLSTITWHHFKELPPHYELILNNWVSKPIEDLRIVGYNETCPENVQLQSFDVLTDFLWSGTTEGCVCKKRLQRKRCSSRQSGSNCSLQLGRDGVNMSNWYNIDNEEIFRICYSTIEQSFIQAQQNCTEEQKSCKTKGNNLFCVSKDSKCPITDLWFGQENSNKNQIRMNGTTSLFYTREVDELPMVEFKISSGGVCQNNLIPRTEDPGYILMNVRSSQCEVDPRFELMNEIKEDTFYEINDMEEIIRPLFDYPKPSNKVNWGLYKRRYIPWNLECRGQTQQKFINVVKDFRKIYDSQFNIFVISVSFFCFLSIIFTFVQIGFAGFKLNKSTS